MKIPIASIHIEDRTREDFGDLQGKAESLRRFGQLVPILVQELPDGQYRLIDGERRTRAARLLEWTEIDAVTRSEDMTPLQLKLLEIETTIQRKDFTWQERAKGTAELVRLRQELYGTGKMGRTQASDEGVHKQDVAEELNVSPSTLSNRLEVAKALELFPELANEEKESHAVMKFRRLKEAAILAELARRGATSTSQYIECGDCLEVLPKMDAASVDVVLFDPPWGIDLMESLQQSKYNAGEEGGLAQDDLEYSRHLSAAALIELDRVMKPNSFIYTFFAIEQYSWWTNILSRFFTVHPIPMIWDKGSHGTVFLGATWPHGYECILFARKGTPKLLKAQYDVLHHPRPAATKRIHVNEKPVSLYQELISVSVPPQSTILDPTCGSGASIEAAIKCQCIARGIEMNPTVHAKAVARVVANCQGAGK